MVVASEKYAPCATRVLAKKCILLRFFLFVFRYLLLNFTERRPWELPENSPPPPKPKKCYLLIFVFPLGIRLSKISGWCPTARLPSYFYNFTRTRVYVYIMENCWAGGHYCSFILFFSAFMSSVFRWYTSHPRILTAFIHGLTALYPALPSSMPSCDTDIGFLMLP